MGDIYIHSRTLLELSNQNNMLRLLLQKKSRADFPRLTRYIASSEKPAIIHERLRTMAAETEAKTEKRMGWLKLATLWGVTLAGGYCVLFQDFKSQSTGEDYEHCFMPIRRVYKTGVDFVLGVPSPSSLSQSLPPPPLPPPTATTT